VAAPAASKEKGAEEPAEESDEEDEEEEELDDWSIDRIHSVKEIILKRHEGQRNGHSSTGPDDGGNDAVDCYDEHKYRILRKHIDNTYKLADGSNKRGTHRDLMPRNPEQLDQLIALVAHECKCCSSLRIARMKKALDIKERRTRYLYDWNLRYQHRLIADEYETDDGHQADPFCSKCGLAGGRKGHMGKQGPHGDPNDKDELHNCEGADCKRAYHLTCAGCPVRDTADTRRQHNLPSDIPLTFGRRPEPCLCPYCWSTAGRKQLDYDRKLLNRERDRLERVEAGLEPATKKPKVATKAPTTSSSESSVPLPLPAPTMLRPTRAPQQPPLPQRANWQAPSFNSYRES
jgi:hypothetical protein